MLIFRLELLVTNGSVISGMNVKLMVLDVPLHNGPLAVRVSAHEPAACSLAEGV